MKKNNLASLFINPKGAKTLVFWVFLGLMANKNIYAKDEELGLCDIVNRYAVLAFNEKRNFDSEESALSIMLYHLIKDESFKSLDKRTQHSLIGVIEDVYGEVFSNNSLTNENIETKSYEFCQQRVISAWESINERAIICQKVGRAFEIAAKYKKKGFSKAFTQRWLIKSTNNKDLQNLYLNAVETVFNQEKTASPSLIGKKIYQECLTGEIQ